MSNKSAIVRANMQQACSDIEKFFAQKCGEPMAVFLVVRPFGPPSPDEHAEWVSNIPNQYLPAFIKETADEVILQASVAHVSGGRTS